MSHRTKDGSTWSMPAMSLKVVRVFPRPSSSRCAPPKILQCTGASCHRIHNPCQVVPPLSRCKSLAQMQPNKRLTLGVFRHTAPLNMACMHSHSGLHTRAPSHSTAALLRSS